MWYPRTTWKESKQGLHTLYPSLLSRRFSIIIFNTLASTMVDKFGVKLLSDEELCWACYVNDCFFDYRAWLAFHSLQTLLLFLLLRDQREIGCGIRMRSSLNSYSPRGTATEFCPTRKVQQSLVLDFSVPDQVVCILQWIHEILTQVIPAYLCRIFFDKYHLYVYISRGLVIRDPKRLERKRKSGISIGSS